MNPPENLVGESSPTIACTYEGCTKKFKKSKSLGEHVRRCHKGQKRVRFNCPEVECDATYRDKSALDVHINRVHKGSTHPHECQLCSEAFRTRELLIKHKKKEHTGQVVKNKPSTTEPFICHTCGKQFFTKDSLRIHFRHHGPRKHVCDVCSKSFVSKNYLNKHMTVHTNEKNFHCAQCQKSFKEGGNLKKHLKICGLVGDKKYKCETCGKIYKTEATYEQHLLVHQGVIEYPYKCDLCDHSVRFKSMLVLHRKSHFKTRDFVCDMCPATFKYKNNLTLHRDVRHLGKRGKHCPVCSYVAIDKQTLEFHLRTHTGERPYSCTVCGNTFTKPHHLKRHSQVHSAQDGKSGGRVRSSKGMRAFKRGDFKVETTAQMEEDDASEDGSVVYMDTEVVLIEGPDGSESPEFIPLIQMENEEIKIYQVIPTMSSSIGEEESHQVAYQVELI